MAPDTKAESFVAGTRKIVQILRYGPRELALATLGLLLLGAIPLLPKLPELPFLTPALPWVTGALALLGLFFLGLSIRRLWKKAIAPLPEGKPKPAAIKGPAPFGPQDAELFARLGRNDDLNRLRGWILDDQKPLVALMGESGVGKTSLLRAGLAHHLQEDKVPVLYWEAVPTEPEAKLLHAVRVGWEEEEKAPKTFEDLAVAVASGRRVVVIDQAEQLSPKGHPRIFELLRQVAKGDPPYRATWVVAFRREFLPVWRDFELSLPETVQRRMETLSLQRFLPKEAEKVIAVLAEEGSLPVDQKLVEELVEGVTVEGKISPADIGISLLVLSELAGGRPDGSLSLDDFRESGGQAGLLTRYLERLLEQFPETERPEVLRGLLALIDLEKDQRLAEGRTLAELEEVVKPASPPRFAAALRFLASAKARVLELGEPVRYRLVHERLIPAIRKLTGVLLAEAERASLALERGYRVWAQDRQSRFLLHRKDLRQVRRFKDHIRWGKDEAGKREFVRLSRQRETWKRLAVVVAIVAAYSAFMGVGELTRKREYQVLLASWGLPTDLYNHLGQLEELTLPGTVTRLHWLSDARRLKRLTIEDGVLESLEGLPAGLETLNVGMSRLSDLSGIPSSLKSLTLGTSRIEIVQGLPETLQLLAVDLSNDAVLELETLPRSLTSLDLVMPEREWNPNFRSLGNLRSLTLHARGREFTFWDRLPDRLRSLSLDQYRLTGFQSVPRNLQSFSFRENRIPSLSELPPALERLDLDYLSWRPEAIRRGPTINVSHLQKLRSLTIQVSHQPGNAGVYLRSLPERLEALKVISEWVFLSAGWPRNLKELELPGGVISPGESTDSLRAANPNSDLILPAGLESLALSWLPQKLPVSLKRLRTNNPPSVLPAGLQSLDLDQGFRNESFSRLPNLPEGLRELKLRGTWVRGLPGNLQQLAHLDVSQTPIDTLERLPPRLKSLTLNVRQVETLEGLPKSVTTLHFHKEWPLPI